MNYFHFNSQGGFIQLKYEVPIFYLDDLCTDVYNLSAVLHYSEWEQEHILDDLYAGTDVKVYAGMKYMPLRDAFEQKASQLERQYSVLITTGGSDTYHITLKVLEAMMEDSFFQKDTPLPHSRLHMSIHFRIYPECKSYKVPPW